LIKSLRYATQLDQRRGARCPVTPALAHLVMDPIQKEFERNFNVYLEANHPLNLTAITLR